MARPIGNPSRTGIYMIYNDITEDFYIGSCASRFTKRWHRHQKDLRLNIHSNRLLQNSFNKYGAESFYYIIIEFCPKENCLEREQYYLDELKPRYNISKTAGSPIGNRHTEEAKRKIGEASKRRIVSNETKQKISRALMGNTNGRFTKGLIRPPASLETRKKMSESIRESWKHRRNREYQSN